MCGVCMMHMHPDLQPGCVHAYVRVCVRMRAACVGVNVRDGGREGKGERRREKVSRSEPYPSGSRPILAQGGKPPTIPPCMSGRP
jgi:hypothetical protein